MKKLFNLSIGFGALIFLVQSVGCSADRPIPTSQLPDYTDKLVLNASLDNLNIMELKVSNTTSAYTEELPMAYNDVTIKMSSSTSTVTMAYDNVSNSFKANRPATPGLTYSIEVSDNKGVLSTATSRCFMPEKLVDKQVSYVENGGFDLEGRVSDVINVKWVDVAGNNFYVLHFYYYSESADLFIPFDFALTDLTLKAPETVKLDDGGFLFNDALFNGREKSISVVPPGGLVAGNSDVLYLVELRSVTEDYYKYHKTLKQYHDSEVRQLSGPFGSAVIVHSNVTNGLGAFISSTLESDTIR